MQAKVRLPRLLSGCLVDTHERVLLMDQIMIDVPDLDDSLSRIVLSGIVYLIRFTYNHTYDCWSFGLYDTQQVPVITGVKIVPQYPLNLFLAKDGMPQGIFGAYSEKEKIGRNDFKDTKAAFTFVPYLDEAVL